MDTITVSVSDFRANMFNYIPLIQEGKTVVVKNEKTDEKLFNVTAPSSRITDEMIEEVRKLKGFLANEPPDTNRAKLRRADMAYARRLKKGLV